MVDEHEAWITALAAADPGGWLWEHDVRQVDVSASVRSCTATGGTDEEQEWLRVEGGEHAVAGFGSAGEFAAVCACVWVLGHRLDDRRHRLLVRSCGHLSWQAEVRW